MNRDPTVAGGKSESTRAWTSEELIEVRSILARLYSSDREIRRVLSDSGNKPEHYDLSGAAITVWFEILRQCSGQEIDAIVAVALRDMNNPALRALVEKRKSSEPTQSGPPALSSRSQRRVWGAVALIMLGGVIAIERWNGGRQVVEVSASPDAAAPAPQRAPDVHSVALDVEEIAVDVLELDAHGVDASRPDVVRRVRLRLRPLDAGPTTFHCIFVSIVPGLPPQRHRTTVVALDRATAEERCARNCNDRDRTDCDVE